MLNGKTIGFIGGGNMAEAIIAGLISTGAAHPSAVRVAEPVDSRRSYLSDKYRIACTPNNNDVTANSDIIVLAIKPQQFDEAVAGLNFKSGALVLSILAGTRTAKIEKSAGPHVRVVRVMPNTPALVGEGMAGIAAGQSATADDTAVASYIFDKLGKSVVVDESQIDLITGVSGSGPAYVFYLVEALRDAAVALGMDSKKADTLARQTFYGSVKLLEESGEDPESLRRKVTSKGGTTERGISILDANNVKDIMKQVVSGATQRSKELS
ncbi:MAG: pyrroline-5-carboxylate reductase [Candidatus Auribacterota bacterium]